jgi:hypothetical protein
MWVLRTDWVRAMWREVPLTLETGEDFHLSSHLKKYLGLKTFLLPNNGSDSQTWASSEDYFGISGAGDSTSGDTLNTRASWIYELMVRLVLTLFLRNPFTPASYCSCADTRWFDLTIYGASSTMLEIWSSCWIRHPTLDSWVLS